MGTSQAPLLRPLGGTGLQCHPLGFGCYRVMEGNATHEAALREYLHRGGNLIDTSANYGDGRSELMVGNILKEYPEGQAIVVTKGGYIQGQNLTLARKRTFPEVVQYDEDLWHSIHPEFLETQLRRSAQRLRRNTLDVYLLHNPEYYLEDAARRGTIGEKQHREFYRRIREAFGFLEEKVRAGEICWYGVSSNNFVKPSSDPTATSIERCWQAAESVSQRHHFRVVQLPLNLYESGGALQASHGGRTALEFCREHGIGVLVNRPLNAFAFGGMVRLADFLKPGQTPPDRQSLRAALSGLRALEEALHQRFEIPVPCGTPGGIAEYLEHLVPQVSSVAHWEQVLYPYLIQPLERWATECQQLYGQHAEWRQWWTQFAEMFPAVLEKIRWHIAASRQSLSDEIRARLRQAGYPADGETLSQMALRLLTQLEGVSSVLVGMRRPEYVADAFGAAGGSGLDGLGILSRFGALPSRNS
ncbi:MAG TPA: aldo/keto reductase [Terriglobia bacterium]|nr:aldo/keto reductase [Terriglobia bacterium]